MAGIHEVLDRLCVLILGGVDCEGVEGIAESRLADELERSARQDGSHLNLISDIYEGRQTSNNGHVYFLRSRRDLGCE
jgi:hypothetical protein